LINTKVIQPRSPAEKKGFSLKFGKKGAKESEESDEDDY
jgi:hypothetical protein